MEDHAPPDDHKPPKTNGAQAERFVAAFSEAWANPDVDGLCRLLDPEVRLYQPVAPPALGLAAARESLGAVLHAMPDVRGEVHGWAASGNCLFISFSLMTTFGKRPFRWKLIDRFTLQNGLALERVSYFDPLPLLGTVLRHPPAWGGWWRAIVLPRLRGKPA